MDMDGKHTQSHPQGQEGLTLLELMIAAGVFVIGFVMLFGSVFSIRETSIISEDRTACMTHLTSLMEDMRALSHSELLAYVPPTITGLVNPSVEVKLYLDGDTFVTPPMDEGDLPEPLPNPCEVQLTVSWIDRNGRPEHASASMLHKEE